MIINITIHAKKAAIVQVGWDLFIREGYDRCSVEKIIALAGIARCCLVLFGIVYPAPALLKQIEASRGMGSDNAKDDEKSEDEAGS